MPGLDTQKLVNELVKKVQTLLVENVVLQTEVQQLREEIAQLTQTLAASDDGEAYAEEA